MSQDRLVVPRDLVASLVDDFLASRKGRDGFYCSNFAPDEVREALRSLPVVAYDAVDFHAASRVITEYECHKAAGRCNTWTPWMRQRLNAAKFPLRRD